ncbi:MAG: hypothetical protein JWO43_604 [Candidatus Adlerbacteria bacterium]|nr:hypothetical protein [Candidatus Adlerbacteria bacterium]
MNKQAGFISIGLLIAIILGVFVVGGGSYYAMQKMPAPQPDVAVLNQGDSHTTASSTSPITQNKKQAASCILNGKTYPDGESTYYTTLPDTGVAGGAGMPITDLVKCQNGKWYDPQAGTYITVTSAASASTVSVPGMSKYTDTDFGFSFWYPSSWKVSTHSNSAVNSYPNGSYDGNISINSPTGHLLTIQKVTSNDFTYRVSAGTCGSCGPVNYFFDTVQHLWMKQYPDGPAAAPGATPEQIAQYKIPKPADVSNNTMGGLHIFSTEQKESAVIIPLSARHFVKVIDNTYTEMCGSSCASSDIKGGATYLAKTVVATDPSVATPVSVAEQTATIKAEAAAYIQ